MDNELDALTRRSESPTVLALQNKVEKLEAHNVELLDLVLTLAKESRGEVDGKFIGPLSTRINFATGRV